MQNFRCAVCENHLPTLAYISGELGRAFSDMRVPAVLDEFFDPYRLLDKVQKEVLYDVLFLDIDMPAMDGIELCRRIRQILPDTLVIFISNKEELVFQTFAVQPFRFLRKSHFHLELNDVLRDLCAEFDRRKKVHLSLQELYTGTVYSFDVKQVLYAEAQGKYCRLVTLSREFSLQYRFAQLEKELAPYGFLRCHRSYLVNAGYIYQIQKNQIILDSQAVLPLSRSRADAVRNAFMKYIQGGMAQ